MHKLHFLILGFNGFLQSKRCIESILRFEPDALVTFLNNGSTDETNHVISAAFGDNPNFSFIDSQHNIGVTAGRNLLLASAAAKSEYLVFIDNDASLSCSVSRTIESSFAANPNLGILGYEGILFDPYMTPYSYVGANLLVDAVSGFFQCFKSTDYQEVGLINSRYKLYGSEDMDYSLEFKSRGKVNRINSDLKITHDYNISSSYLDKHIKSKHETENQFLFKQKWHGRLDLLEVERQKIERLVCAHCDDVWVRKP